MESLTDAVASVQARRQTLDVYAQSPSVATVLAEQFSTRNVSVRHRPMPARDEPGFVLVRDAAGEFRGAIGLDRLDALLSPDRHPPWELDAGVDTAAVFTFLDNTLFTSASRRQLLAVTREIEERAWRIATGHLVAGFQTGAALAAQSGVYDRLATETDLTVRVLVADEWDGDLSSAIDVLDGVTGEIGDFWVVCFDGEETRLNTSAIVAEERDSGRFRGFWTDDPDRVAEIATYLDATYVGETDDRQ
ncbi:histidine kinase [Halovivax cerinus]|uniref:Histidine kinase n=1 Tax=Halovivax cerinus TaxID=1487865 RepID=A0ABD5NJQ4_9EURY|nr:histidine kinase [Halovivax cerinus]